MGLLSNDERAQLAKERSGWTVEADSMRRTFTFEDFVGAMGFVSQVALLAEKAFHHPDIDIRWNRVTLVLSTHSEGGLTNKDAEVAAAIDRIGG